MENPKFSGVKHDPFILDVTHLSAASTPAECDDKAAYKAMLARAMPARDVSFKINSKGKP
jgi:hypothetical protein